MPKFNPIFLLGSSILLSTPALLFLPQPEPSTFSLLPALGSDGRCTGFPNGIGQWDWSACCQVHDLGGTDADLATCLLSSTPPWAAALVFLALALMAFCRPIYNLGQRWRIWK